MLNQPSAPILLANAICTSAGDRPAMTGGVVPKDIGRRGSIGPIGFRAVYSVHPFHELDCFERCNATNEIGVQYFPAI